MCQAGFHRLVLESNSALITVYSSLRSVSRTTVNKSHQPMCRSRMYHSWSLCLPFLAPLSVLFSRYHKCLHWTFMRKFCATNHDRTGCYEATEPTDCPFVWAPYEMWNFRKIFHNSLLLTEVFWLPTLTPMSGCYYCSCWLRIALCLPGTFSLIQPCGRLAGSLCIRVCVLYLCLRPLQFYFHWSAHRVLICMCVCVQCVLECVYVRLKQCVS